MKEIILHEISCLKKELMLFIAVLSLICTVVIVIISFSIQCYAQVDDTVDAYADGSEYFFKLDRSDSEIRSRIREIGFQSYKLEYVYFDTVIETGHFIYNGKEFEADADSFNAESSDWKSVSEAVIKGEEFSASVESENEYIPVWISKDLSEDNSIYCGDIIKFVFNETDMESELMVKGIVSSEQCRGSIVLDYISAGELLKEGQISTRSEILGIAEDYHSARKCAYRLEKEHISYSCPLYDNITEEVENYYVLCGAFLALGILVAGVSILTFFSYINVIKIKRKHYAALLKALGANTGRIVFVYFIIMELMTIAALIMCTLASYLLYNWISDSFADIFKFDMISFRISPCSFLIAFGTLNLIIFINIFKLYSMLNGINEVNELRSNE